MPQTDVQQSTMSFASQQLAGIYHTGAYRRMVRCFSDANVDERVIHEIEAAAESVRGNDPTSMTHYSLFFATSTCVRFVNSILDGEVNTLDITQWLSLIDSLSSANRLICVPDYRYAEALSVPQLVMGVALAADVMFRAADKTAQQTAPLPDDSDETVTKRAFGIYRDIMCGRVGFWISAASDLACQVCMLVDADWQDVHDRWASGRMIEFVNGAKEAFEIDERAASSVLVSQTVAFAQLFDDNQSSVWDDTIESIELPTPEQQQAVFDEDTIGTFIEHAPDGLCDVGEHLRGFCEASGVSPVDSVFFLTRQASAECTALLMGLSE